MDNAKITGAKKKKAPAKRKQPPKPTPMRRQEEGSQEARGESQGRPPPRRRLLPRRSPLQKPRPTRRQEEGSCQEEAQGQERGPPRPKHRNPAQVWCGRFLWRSDSPEGVVAFLKLGQRDRSVPSHQYPHRNAHAPRSWHMQNYSPLLWSLPPRRTRLGHLLPAAQRPSSLEAASRTNFNGLPASLPKSEDPERDIYLINSPGGVITAGMAIYDTMQFIRPDVATICWASRPRWLLCFWRLAPCATLLPHSVSAASATRWLPRQASDEIHAKEILRVKLVPTTCSPGTPVNRLTRCTRTIATAEESVHTVL